MGRTINGKTTTLALIGDPVGHSLSPQMHNYACEQFESCDALP